MADGHEDGAVRRGTRTRIRSRFSPVWLLGTLEHKFARHDLFLAEGKRELNVIHFIVVSCFVGDGGSFCKGITMGVMIAVFHVLSSIVVVLVADFAVNRSGFGTHIPDSVETAELAGMSVRTFQRRLHEEGYRFRELVDELRFDEAEVLLADPTFPIAAIGRHLGYPDAANFTHAFRRWAGEAPHAFRCRLAS